MFDASVAYIDLLVLLASANTIMLASTVHMGNINTFPSFLVAYFLLGIQSANWTNTNFDVTTVNPKSAVIQSQTATCHFTTGTLSAGCLAFILHVNTKLLHIDLDLFYYILILQDLLHSSYKVKWTSSKQNNYMEMDCFKTTSVL